MPAPAPSLQGKVVDSEEIVRATEVPFGGYGVFPKADLSEIFIKSWNNNGTTQIISYRPVIEPKPEDIHDTLLQKMNSIEQKIDNISVLSVPKKQEPIIIEKKGLNTNA